MPAVDNQVNSTQNPVVATVWGFDSRLRHHQIVRSKLLSPPNFPLIVRGKETDQLKASVLKPMLADIERGFVLRKLGRLQNRSPVGVARSVEDGPA